MSRVFVCIPIHIISCVPIHTHTYICLRITHIYIRRTCGDTRIAHAIALINSAAAVVDRTTAVREILNSSRRCRVAYMMHIFLRARGELRQGGVRGGGGAAAAAKTHGAADDGVETPVGPASRVFD